MILIIDCGSEKTKNIGEIIKPNIDVNICKLNDFKLDDLKNIKGVIISGAPILLSEFDTKPYIEKFKWIKTTKFPILGICFGHQIIGLIYGSFIKKIVPVRTWEKINTIKSSDLLFSLPLIFEMMEDHCEIISIPKQFNHIASSNSSANEMMEHKEKKIFGVQFHPEVSGNLGHVLLGNFIKICLNDK
ncbi:MAG: hypothetical protein CL844_01755 [Crocinitomicaceae bacterium]|nr:hypothetical protein [Crocinitomicaceae bacterium]|tara:strand:+ start:40412 stop:40975 length:564 start_codon:yes stop_codon:yes gene_type:complete